MLRYLSSPFKWFFKLEAASGLILLISAIVALIISNSSISSLYFESLNKYIFIGINNFGLKLSVLHWINDALMAIFFFFVTLEIKREFLQGELSNIKLIFGNIDTRCFSNVSRISIQAAIDIITTIIIFK